VLLLLVFCSKAYAQQPNLKPKKFSIDLGAGATLPLMSIPGDFSYDIGLGVRYSFSHIFSGQIMLNTGKLTGSNPSAPTAPLLSPRDPKNYIYFTNQYYTINGNVQVNLTQLFRIKPFDHRYNPYIVLGMGRMIADLKTERYFSYPVELDNFNFYIYNVGLANKIYLTKSFDLQFSAIFTGSQSPFIDLIGFNTTDYDDYLTFSAGITYKVGKGKDRESMDWSMRPPKHERQQQQKEEQRQKDMLANYKTPCADSVDVLNKKINELAIENDTLKNEIQALKKQLAAIPPRDTTPLVAVAPITGQNNLAPKTGSTKPMTKQDSLDILGKDVELPQHKYNVIIASFRNFDYARKYADMMRKKGYNIVLQKFTLTHDVMRVCILSTDDKREALKMLRMAEASINPETWIYTVPDK
jgi:cell division septation protein DedD